MEPGRIYIASTLGNAERVRALTVALRSAGAERGLNIQVTYDWTSHSALPEAGGMVYIPDDQPALKRAVAIRELVGVLGCDVLLVVMPGERGTHFEFGVAFAVQKPIVLLLDRHDGKSPSFHFLDSVVRVHTEAEAFTAIFDLLARPPSSAEHPMSRWG